MIDHVDGSESLCPVGNHVFSSIWALGEIAVDHRLGSEVEELLLECARHDNQLVRREAYLALMKLHSEKLGPILADRLAYMPEDGPVLDAMYDDIPGLAYEMNTVADWIIRFGTALQKEALTNALARPLAKLTGPSKYAYLGPQHEKPAVSDWFEWVVWRAAGTQDARLLAPLQDLYTRLARANAAESALGFVQRALAACGSAEATETLVRQIDDDESRVLAVGGAPTVESMTSLGSLDLAVHFGYPSKSLRVQILQQQRCRYEFYPMPSEAGDRALRSALSEKASDDWYALYLLAEIKEPQSGDRDRLMRIWESGDLWLRVVVADVLYAWADGQMLLSLYERTESDEIESEIAWALADLRVAEAVPIIEERIVNSWNRDWLSFSRAFLMWTSLDDAAMDDPKAADAMRKAEAVQRYFHPAWEDLDEERLAALKRLGENSTIHPGLRFELFATDYATKDWAKPLFRKSLRELLEAYPHSATVNQLVSQIDARLVVDACGASDSDAFRRNLLINLLAGGSVYNLAVVEGLLWEVWPQRYRETQGQSILFREPGELMASLDYYCQHAQRAIHGLRPGSGIFTYRPVEPALQSIVQDDSLPTGYRAFLLAYWQTAPGWFLREYVENLLEEDMPDFIRAALQMRLLDWQYSLEKVTF